MDEPRIAAAQARMLRAAVDHAGLSLHQVWMHYFSIGGNAGEVEVEAFLHHALPLPVLERDLLAHAVNELVDHRRIPRAPYTSELVDAQESGATDNRSLNPDEARDD